MTSTVTRVRGLGVDEDGDPIEGDDDRLAIAGCFLAPGQGVGTKSSSGIEERGREGVIEGLTLYAPFDADIRHNDQIELADTTLWDIDGDVGQWENGFTGWQAGLQVILKRAEG